MTGYRTIIFNILMAIVMVVRAKFPDMILPPDEELTKMFSTILSAITIIGNIILRLITKGPIGNSNPDCK